VPDILELADRLWRGELGTDEFSPFSHIGGVCEVADGVAFTPSFANVVAIDSSDGLVLVDTGSALTASAVHGDLRGWSGRPLHTAIYTHGHVDHATGMPVWELEAERNGAPAPTVVAHEAVRRRFDRYRATAGYNEIINRRQFGWSELRWPTTYRYPDLEYRETLELSVGGRDLVLRHELGETDDHTVVWLAEEKVLCCGDLIIWASPNAGNPQKVQRFPREWAAALRRMAALGAEVLLPGHGLPILGNPRITEALTDTADLLDSLVDQTLELMNAGARLDEVVHSVAPPAHLGDKPYLRPVYDEPEFIVHNVWRLYGGWWDGNPASLKPAPERAVAAELAALAGGAGALAERARELAATGGGAGSDDGGRGGRAGDAADRDLALAAHLAELAWQAAPGDPAIARVRSEVFGARSRAARSTMSRGVFGWAARESGPPESPGA
jgi:glyoxylase-like metal-dependent hydrolase (beta-lactamase superfamily II)